jgi:phosphatidate cytidylyltransferase
MKRLLTAVVGIPLALLAVFRLPGGWFLLGIVALLEIAVSEYIKVGEHWAPGGVLKSLLVLVPAASFLLAGGLLPSSPGGLDSAFFWLALILIAVGSGALAISARAPLEQGATSMGLLAFGIPYFALPAASLYRLQVFDPWVLVLLLAIVWMGDSGAYYIGKAWGRHKLAPRVSPNKTWEGAIASIASGLLAAAVWSYWRLGAVDGRILLLAGLVSIAGQIGDLVESLLKRGAGVKDSGAILPGHGGMLDRMDALLFAAPVMWLGVELLGPSRMLP